MYSLLILSIFLGTARAGVTVPKERFIEAMEAGLPNNFCADNMYFRQCFRVSKEICLREALRATKACVASIQFEIPPKLNQPDDGKKFGTRIGSCAGTNYEKDLATKKVNSANCKDTSKWH